MKKNAIALAVGALFVAPAAHSQTVLGNDKVGTVQIYGKLYPQFAIFKSSGSTAAGEVPSNLVTNTGGDHGRRNSIDTASSYLGFRGERLLGATGMKAIWQIEQETNFDESDPDGTMWSTRNSFAGISGAFGVVKLGNMDTIYKDYGDNMSMFGVSAGNFISASNMLSHIGVGNNRSARFHERKPNSLQYQTPEFGDFQAGLQYSPDEAKGDPGVTLDQSLWSYGVKYDSERFYVSLHQEIHNDFFGGSNNVAGALSNAATPGAGSKDRGTRLTTEAKFGGHRLVAEVARLQYKETGQAAGTRFVSYEHTNWTIGWDARWGGPWRTGIQYIRGGEGKCALTVGDCSTAGLKGTMVTAGVAYYFDRQTLLYGIAARLENGPSARYDNWPNGSPSRGADLTQAAIGLSYTF